MAEKRKIIPESYVKTVFILFAAGVLTFGVIISAVTCQPHYTWFTERRIARMEDRFSIAVTENIKLLEYEMSEFPDYRNPDSRPEFEYRLCLETKKPEKFMTENVRGIITEKYADMNFTYRNKENQAVHAEVCRNDSSEAYRITLVIVDL